MDEKNNYLSAILTIQRLLLESPNRSDKIYPVLRCLGETLAVERVFLSQLISHPTNNHHITKLIEDWSPLVTLPSPSLKLSQTETIEDCLGDNFDRISQGHCLFVSRNHLTALGISAEGQAGVTYPILVGDRLWGYIAIELNPGDIPLPEIKQQLIELTANGIALEKKYQSQEYKESQYEKFYQTVFSEAEIGLVRGSLDGRFQQVNHKLCEIVGYPETELMALSFQEITYPEDLGTDLHYVQQLLAGKIKRYSMEKRYIRSDQSLVWVSLHVTLIRDANESPLYYIAAVQDINAQKQVEADLREREVSFHQTLSQLPYPVIIHNLNDDVLFVNQTWTNITGYHHSEISTINAWISKAEVSEGVKIKQIIENVVIAKEKTQNICIQIKTKAGSVRIWNFVSTNLGHIFNQDNVVLSTAVDMTEQIATEQKIKLANQQLSDSVALLKKNKHQADLLNHLNLHLQSCQSLSESLSIIETIGAELLEHRQGFLAIADAGGKQLTTLIRWGHGLNVEDKFSPQSCWGVRRGKRHLMSDPNQGICCHHFQGEKVTTPYYCEPLINNNDLLGILGISLLTTDSMVPDHSKQPWEFELLGELLALSLSNLKFRQLTQKKLGQDSVTGCQNREAFLKMLENEKFKQRNSLSASELPFLTIFGIENFKQVNQLIGYDIGSQLLKKLLDNLRQHLAPKSTIFRYEGMIFIISSPTKITENLVNLIGSCWKRQKQQISELVYIDLHIWTENVSLTPEKTQLFDCLIQEIIAFMNRKHLQESLSVEYEGIESLLF